MKDELQNPAPKRRVTIREIAAAAGVHFTTVGLALRGSAQLPPATRERIRQIADSMGYRPDPMLSALNAYRRAKSPPQFQATIAWINNWPRREQLYAHEEFREYYKGAADRAKQVGYTVEEFWLQESGMQPNRINGIFRARNIEAVLLAPQPAPRSAAPLDCSQFATLVFGYSLQPPVFHVVTNHHFHSMNLMLAHLQEFGYTRIGLLVAPDWDDKVENAWIGGLTLARSKNRKLKNVPPLLEKPAKSDKDLRTWIDSYQPDVIVSYTEALPQLRKLGVKIPEDLGFASLSVQRIGAHVSGLYQNNLQIGRMAVDYIIAMLHSGERGVPAAPTRILVESVWNPGSTLRSQF